MDAAHLSPARVPQRVVVAGNPGPELATLLSRLAGVLDVPLVPATDLAGRADIDRLAAFDGWVTTADQPVARAVLLERAEVVVHLLPEVSALRSIVRRTVRRIRAEAPAPDLPWLDGLTLTHPDLPLVRLQGQHQVEAWLSSLSA